MKSTIRRILKESVHQKVLDKMSSMIRLPYFDFLKKNGVSDEDVETILIKHFKNKYGDGKVNFEIKSSKDYSGVFYLDIELMTKSGDGLTNIAYNEYIDGPRGVYWSLSETIEYFDRFGDKNVFTYRINSVGNKNYCWTQDNKCYDNYDKNNWDEISHWADKVEIFNMK